MTINNKNVGSPAAGSEIATNTGDVLPKLVNHNTPEQAFQEGIAMMLLSRWIRTRDIDIVYGSLPRHSYG